MNSQPSTSLVYSPHPLLAARGRQVVSAPFLPGESIAAYLVRQDISFGSQPVVLALEGEVIPRDEWATTYPAAGNLLTVRATVEGGGGGSNPLRTILTIAVMIYAPEIAAMIYESVAAAGAGAWLTAGGMQVLTGVVMIGGQLLVNALLPPPKPNLSARSEKSSPTYSLSGGSNRARPYEPLPLVLGTHRIFPDMGARFYVEYEGNDQYLYQVFHFGLSEVALSDFRIGESPLGNFGGVEVETSGPDGVLKLFPSNVQTAQGGNLSWEDWLSGHFDQAWYLAQYPDVAKYEPGPLKHWVHAGKKEGRIPFVGYNAAEAGWMVRESSDGAVALAVDLTGSLYRAGDGGIESLSASFSMEYREVGATAWLPFARGETTITHTHYWSAGYWKDGEDWARIWVQLAHGSTQQDEHQEGAVYGDSAYWRWRPFSELTADERANPNGIAPPEKENQPTTVITLTNANSTPVRKTWKISVPEGRYEVRVRRETDDERDERNQSSVIWAQLRSYRHDNGDYTGQTRVALKIKATGQLNGTVEQLSAVAKSSVPVWENGVWVQRQSCNPAWLFLYFARGKFINGRRVFGGGLPDRRIDIEAIKEWAVFCDAKRLTFSAVIDQTESAAEVLIKIARCGRAFPTWATGTLGVVWHAANEPTVAVFGMANIKRGTFRVDYVTEKLADEVIVNFINPKRSWQQDSVRALVPGITQPKNSVTLDLVGCCDAGQAGREANLLAASQYYHRRRMSWETDVEGLTVNKGSVVVLSHDLTQWDFSGRLVLAEGNRLHLDQTVPFIPGQPHYIGVRWPTGYYDVLPVQAVEGETDTLTLTGAWPTDDDRGLPLPHPGSDPHHPPVDYLWFFGPRPTPGKLVRITGIQPLDELHVRITATDEEAGYYQYETAPYAYVPPPVYTWGASCRPPTDLNVFETLTVDANGQYGTQAVVQFFPSPDLVKRYVVQGRVPQGEWIEIANGPAVRYTYADIPRGQFEVRVRAVGYADAVSVWVTQTVTLGGASAPLSRIGLPAPEAPKLFYTERDDAIDQVRLVAGYSLAASARPDGLLLMYSVMAVPNKLGIVAGGLGSTLTIGAAEVMGTCYDHGNAPSPILAGSTRGYIKIATPTAPLADSLDFAGAYWGKIPGSEWRKATGHDRAGIFFGEPFDVEPQVGGGLEWAEVAWRDERTAEFRLAALVSPDGRYEIVRWSKIDQVGNAFVLLGVERGQEGTTPIPAEGCTLWYYPAPGAGTVSVNLGSDAHWRESSPGVFEATANINVRVPPKSTIVFTCGTWRQTPDGFLRSPIVPAIYGGAL